MAQYEPVYPPYPHQVEARDKMRSHPAFALLMGKRTGKSKTLIDDWGEREAAGVCSDLIVWSPAGSLYGEDTWETQVPEHLPPELRERARVVIWRSGMGKGRMEELRRMLAEADPRRPRIFLVNTEAMSTAKAAIEACRTFLQTSRALRRGATAVAGESTSIKGDSERTGQIINLADMAQWRRIESGLVAPHSPLDLFWQFYFLDPKILGHHSWWGFRARYAILKEVNFKPGDPRSRATKIVVGYRNEDELRDRIAPYSYRKELRDCYDAPPPKYQFRDVEMTPEQARLYKDLRRYATAELEGVGHVTAPMAMTRITRLHQIACGVLVDEAGNEHDIPERRTAAIIDMLRDYGGKAVIWCAYDACVRRVIAALKREFGPESTAAFWGGNRPTREDEERRFKHDDRCRNMVATAGAGGKGREWSLADLTIYHSNTPNLEHRDQSEGRTEAVGKVDPRTMVDIRVPGTVDDKWIKNLRDKITMASTLQGDGYREWLI